MAYAPVLTSAFIAFNGLLTLRDQTSLEGPVEATCAEHGHDPAWYGIILHTAYDIQKFILNDGHKAYTIMDDILSEKKRSVTYRALEKSQLDFIDGFIVSSQICLDLAENENPLKKTFFKHMQNKMTMFAHFLDIPSNVQNDEATPVAAASMLVDNTIKEFGSAIIGYQPKVIKTYVL